MNLHLQSLRFQHYWGNTSGKLCMKNMLGKRESGGRFEGDKNTGKKRSSGKNHQFIMSPGSKHRKKRFCLFTSLDFSLKCFVVFVSAVLLVKSGEREEKKGKLKLIQPYEHSSDMRWSSYHNVMVNEPQ
jgi:hypothetical protein